MTLLPIALALLLASAVAALLCGRRSRPATVVALTGVLGGGGLAAVAAVGCLAGGATATWRASWGVPGGALVLTLDPLAACFVLPIAVLAMLCAIYGAAYLAGSAQRRALAPHWFFYNLLVAALLLVVLAANALLFLAAWEAMTLASFFLVAWDHRLPEVRRAAWLYLLAAHCGLMLLLALFVDAGTYCGSFDFADFAPLAQLPLPAASFGFLLALFGFGVKAGLLPLHVWLPDAHPAAPSHVSALMSGVLVKTGLYGILRTLTLLPAAPAWWGWLLVLFGIAGALYGIALAGLQDDIKRSLAYSTIENVGLIVLGIGFSLVARAAGQPEIAGLALAGALLHLWNHALFKGALFLGAGALAHAAHSRELSRMGGLLRRLPLTGALLLGACLAISALPPFNGLASEWLLYLALLRAGAADAGFAALPALLLVGALGVVGALALVTFSRLAGIALLGAPRSAAAAAAREVSPLMRLPLALLVGACLVLGLRPDWGGWLLRYPLQQLAGVPVVLPAALSGLGAWSFLAVLAAGGFALLLLLLRHRRPGAVGATWGCGYRFPAPRMAYTAGAYAELTWRHLLPGCLRPALGGEPVAGLFPITAARLQQSLDPVLQRWLQPLFVRAADGCQRLRWLQQGRLPVYLLYMFVLSTVLLVWVFLSGRGG